MHDLVVIALSAPVLIGIYDKNGRLVEKYSSEEKSSEALPRLFKQLMSKYSFGNIVYANGPGSFMAIKLSYIFLKTFCLVKNIRLLAVDAFYFNGNAPIKAVGKLYFVKTSEAIITKVFEAPPESVFCLPSRLTLESFKQESTPFYGISAVG